MLLIKKEVILGGWRNVPKIQYVSFPTSTYTYTGMAPKLEWKNNLKGYTATLEDASALDKNVGAHSANVKVKYSNGVDITVEGPLRIYDNSCSFVIDCE